jgi:hypothetical protein
MFPINTILALNENIYHEQKKLIIRILFSLGHISNKANVGFLSLHLVVAGGRLILSLPSCEMFKITLDHNPKG